VHLLGEVKHPQQSYTGEKYDVGAADCIVPVARATLVAAPGSNTEWAVPSGCVLVRRVQRLTYGGDTVCIPEGGFGLRELKATEMQQECWTGGESAVDGFVELDTTEDSSGSNAQDVTHASPQDLFVVPECWVQPASYFLHAAHLGHYNDSVCAKCRKSGKLTLCDDCPRAYHDRCMSKDERERAAERGTSRTAQGASTHASRAPYANS